MRVPFFFDRIAITDFCQRWKVVEIAFFGSVLRADFGPQSDVDVMVTFDGAAHPTLFDFSRMQDELSNLFNRPVDLVTRAGVENSRNVYRRREILATAEVIHAA